MAATDESPAVVLCIATFRRPRRLRALVASLAEQRFTDSPPAIQLVVVDNDTDRSAEPVVRELSASLPFAVHYRVEPTQNIALARNRGVALGLALGAEWFAFIDDDEVAQPDWLECLLRAQRRTGAPVVAGQVVPSFEPGTPTWIEQGEFFGSPGHSPRRLHLANTSNVLVSASLLREADGPFDARFGLTGGSDMHLFLRLHHLGVRTAWVPEAVVQDVVPSARTRIPWVLQRAFRHGHVAFLCERALWGSGGRPVSRLAKATGRLALGIFALPVSLLRDRTAVVRALCNVSYGLGAATALLGFEYEEYRYFHGE